MGVAVRKLLAVGGGGRVLLRARLRWHCVWRDSGVAWLCQGQLHRRWLLQLLVLLLLYQAAHGFGQVGQLFSMYLGLLEEC